MSEAPKTLIHKPFYFLRHGETAWNKERKWQGAQDIPLNQTGLAQAAAVRPFLENLGIKTICVSPLQRATKTADLAAGHLGARVETLEGLREVGFGPYEGTGHLDNPWYEDWKRGLHVEGVEGHSAFIERSLVAINHALAFEGPILIVAHGGVFWSVREHARLDPDLSAWNCALFELTPPNKDRPFWLHEALNQRP
jgi:probable phosphoglycerate mutase